MKKNEKIYVVTRGDYSDYHIITATTDPNHAYYIAEKFKAEVEIYDDSKMYLKNIYFVCFDPLGDIDYCELEDEYCYPYKEKIIYHKNQSISIRVEADDKQSAIKIAAEKRAKFLAEQEGIA